MFAVGLGPMVRIVAAGYLAVMNLLLVLVLFLLMFGGGGYYYGGPVYGGSGLGLVLVVCLVVYFLGGFRSKT